MGPSLVAALGVFAVFTLGACARSSPTTDGPPPRAQEAVSAFEGKVQLTDGSVISLEGSSKPTFLIFASDFCSICSEEARELAALFKERGGLPTNVRVLTVLIGAHPEDTNAWITSHGVIWPTGVDEGDSLFRSLCAVQQTPCAVTHHPATNRTSVRNGRLQMEDIEKETGRWEYP